MSTADEIKQENERAVFLSACDFCKSNNVHIRTKSIMNYLNGEYIDRDKNDKPDLINKCTKGKNERFVGIELFYVDQNSKKSKECYKSNTLESRSHLEDIYNAGHEQYEKTGNVSPELCEKLLKEGYKLAQNGLSSQYQTLLSAFEHHFTHHASRAKLYRDNIKRIAESKEIELAFFIEIETYFHDLFLNERNRIIQYKSKIMPFFSDIVSIINSDENKKYIDYIVFDLKSKHPDERKIIAIRTGKIKKNLKNQDVTIYEYVGENALITNPRDNDYERNENGDYRVSFLVKDTDQDGDSLKRAFNSALRCKKGNIPFVTSRRVQAQLYISKAKSYKEMVALEENFKNRFPTKELVMVHKD